MENEGDNIQRKTLHFQDFPSNDAKMCLEINASWQFVMIIFFISITAHKMPYAHSHKIQYIYIAAEVLYIYTTN